MAIWLGRTSECHAIGPSPTFSSKPLKSRRDINRFCAGQPLLAPQSTRGRRGAHLTRATATIAPDSPCRWVNVLDTGCDAAHVADLLGQLTRPTHEILDDLADDAQRSARNLRDIVAAADGIQHTADPVASIHHSANVLFNLMRGGVPPNGYWLSRSEVIRFFALRNRDVLANQQAALAALPERLTVMDLIGHADASSDPDARRLLRELLPLSFSRRHGDPSRPWNDFEIPSLDPNGTGTIDYQGNWRDVFQNWEALSWSYPDLVEGMILTFLDAVTVDGYNPYRITHSGVDWEVPELDNPWSNIGYWSDHQIVYLSRLLAISQRFHPGRLSRLLTDRSGVYAAVPYQLAAYEQIVADPVNTIAFRTELDRAARERAAAKGGDGMLLHDDDGHVVRTTMAEKLLLLLSAKLVNLVPTGGLWMTTQRPEWNDANNALVGRGLSVVTVAQLVPFVAQLRGLLIEDVEVSDALAELIEALTTAMTAHLAVLDSPDGESVRAAMDDLGRAGTTYRNRAYGLQLGRSRTMSVDRMAALFDVTERHLLATLRANRRSDGLFHSYNTVDLTEDGARIGRLQVMLEGQVAVLDSGLLTPAQALDVLRALRASALYDPDRGSYLLYPDRELPGFLEANAIPATASVALPILDRLAEDPGGQVIVRDRTGQLYFAGDIRHTRDLTARLDELADGNVLVCGPGERDAIADLFETLFHYHEFTGRSGRFFAYEGLGSVYWHMVGKLVLAVQGQVHAAHSTGADPAVIDALTRAYDDIRLGLGVHRPASHYGAFPTDPYSHSPRGQGARQPGMTGQVKEAVLARWGELGVRVEAGRLGFAPLLLPQEEYARPSPAGASSGSDGDADRSILRFTFCGVPVTYSRVSRAAVGDSPGPLVTARLADSDDSVRFTDGMLSAELSAAVFRRDGSVTALEVEIYEGDPRKRSVTQIDA